MLYDIVKAYPDLGSFLYGHWEDVELTPTSFLILMGVLLTLALSVCLCGLVGYVLGSVALARIAKKQGAWRGMRVMACMPFARYFAIGKMAERCDVMDGTQKRRLWSRILLFSCIVLILLVTVLLMIALIGLPGMQLFIMFVEDGGSFLWDTDSKVINAIMLILYLLLILIAIPFIAVRLFGWDLFVAMFVFLPFVGLAALLIGTLLLAALRALTGVCYYKMLRGYFPQKSALLLTVGGAVTGWTPIILLIASRKKSI